MLTLSATAQKMLDKGAFRPVYRVDFGDNFGDFGSHPAAWLGTFLLADEPFYFRDSSNNEGFLPQLVVDVDGLSQELDMLGGTASTGTITVELEDHTTTRDLVADNRLLGKDIIVYLGFYPPPNTLWLYTDWVPRFRGIITDVDFGEVLSISAATFDAEHLPSRGKGIIAAPTIPGYTGIALSAHTTINDDFALTVANPLTFIDDMLTHTEVPARFIDSTSIDPSTADNDPIAHLRLSINAWTVFDRRIGDSMSVWDAIQEIARLCHGFVHFTEEGKFTFKRFDINTSVVASWGDDDIKGEPELVSSGLNSVVTSTAVACAKTGKDTYWWGQHPPSSQHAVTTMEDNTHMVLIRLVSDKENDWGYSPEGTGRRKRELQFNDDWFGAVGHSDGSWSAAAPATLNFGAEPDDAWVKGTRIDATDANGWGWPGTGTGVEAVSAARPIWLAIMDPLTGDYCICKYTGLSHTANSAAFQATGGTFVTGDNTITATNHGDLVIIDVTAAYMLAEEWLAIFSDSASTVSLRTRPHTYPVQVGDFVHLNTDRFVDFGYTGDPGLAKFLVLSKQVDKESLEISWKLMKAVDTSPTFSSNNLQSTKPPGAFRKPLGWGNDVDDRTEGISGNVGFDAHVVTGIIGPTDPGLTHSVTEGAYVKAGKTHIVPPFDHTYTNAKDTWVFAGDTAMYGAPRLEFVEVNNGAPKPVTPANTIPIMRVRASGGAITEVLDLRNRGMVGTVGLADHETLTTFQDETAHYTTISGFQFTEVAGLTQTFPAGVAMINGTRVERLQDEDHTFTASKDTYVDVGLNGDLSFTETALGAGEPLQAAINKHRLCVVKTDLTDVTHIGWYPQERNLSSRAISPQGIRDFFTPNGLMDDLQPQVGLLGWTTSAPVGITVTATTDNVKAGRHGLNIAVDAAAGTGYIRSDVFEIWARGSYVARWAYSTGGFSESPNTSIGLEYFDYQKDSLGTRNFVLSAGKPGDDASSEGGVLEGALEGHGASTDQIPPTARYARWVVEVDGGGLAGTPGMTLSILSAEPGVANTLMVQGSATAYNIKDPEDRQVLALDTSSGWVGKDVSHAFRFPVMTGAGTHDWKTDGAEDPATHLTATGAADFDTVERTASGIQVALAAPGSDETLELNRTWTSSDVAPFAFSSLHGILIRIDPTTLSAHANNLVEAFIGDAGSRNHAHVRLWYTAAARYVYHRTKRANTPSGSQQSTVASWASDAWLRCIFNDETQKARHQIVASPYTAVDPTDVTSQPLDEIIDDGVKFRLYFNVPSGASLDVLIKEIILLGMPFA